MPDDTWNILRREVIKELDRSGLESWALFAHFYEKDFAKADNERQLNRMFKNKLRQEKSPRAQRALHYFYNYRKGELGESKEIREAKTAIREQLIKDIVKQWYDVE